MSLSEDVAFVFHEQWRKTRLNADGTYNPRWKAIKSDSFAKRIENMENGFVPKYVRQAENGGWEIDIANAYYTQLSPDWQAENKAAAEVVAKMVESGKQYTMEQVGDIIHNAWLERNAWAKDSELGVPFAQLPKEEQDKDLVQYETALLLSRAKDMSYKEEFSDLNDVYECVDKLVERRKKGENIKCQFNDYMLYSEYETKDSANVKACGMTIDQARAFYIKERMYLDKMSKQGKIVDYERLILKNKEEEPRAMEKKPEETSL